MINQILKLADSKKNPLNILINSDMNVNFLVENFLENENLLNLTHIKTNKIGKIEYSIIREGNTKTWFFTSKNLYILHLPLCNYKNFYNTYKNSTKYKFIIYVKKKLCNLDDSPPDLFVFCISHVIDDKNYDEFMELNKLWSKNSAYVLNKRLGFFIPLNISYIDFINKEYEELSGINIIGKVKQEKQYEIYSVINFVLTWINSKHNRLPYHSLILNK